MSLNEQIAEFEKKLADFERRIAALESDVRKTKRLQPIFTNAIAGADGRRGVRAHGAERA